MLIFFGYTYCPDVCPTTLAIEAEALDKIGARASQIVPIFVTVDPSGTPRTNSKLTFVVRRETALPASEFRRLDG
jgi:cytochrome oxidase Cu insertion factor (SCO1/SenC/PrrC family)